MAASASPTPGPRVVIIGGGFAGLACAQGLAGAKARVTIVDRTNHHLFQPLLYQVAMAGLSPADIAVPIRSVLHDQDNVRVLLGEVSAIDVAAKTLETNAGPLTYDYLVVAAGARNNYFGHDDWGKAAPGLKTIDDAIDIRRRVLLALEAAEQTTDAALRRALLTFVVIGGGATGVELAGALSELSRYIVARDFRHVRHGEIKVILLEGGPSILTTFKPELQKSGIRQLEALGVEVRMNAKVTAIDHDGVTIDSGGASVRIDAETVLWGAGVKAQPISAALGAPTDRGGRVIVGKELTIPGHDDVFVIGDIAAITDADGKPVPGVAPAASQAGRLVAKAIRATIAGKPRPVFRYLDKGSLATIGRSAAVGQFGKLGFSGFIAWMLWMAVHVLFLVGFRNRYVVMLEWIWHYLSFQRGARLITGGMVPGTFFHRAAPDASVAEERKKVPGT
ncbi:MAG: NAD(P)/FAD-dependent oxidoreductase [Deltaproteobacteria bacterium]|nr:NAD(P)/FAD-dependent oxidoreductase [Deltaproteobacteria bacterium]